MITVSQDVIEALYETLLESGLAGSDTLRLNEGHGGYQLEVDEPQRDDRVIWFQENPVLAIAPSIDESLGNAVIELTDSEGGERLVLVIRTES